MLSISEKQTIMLEMYERVSAICQKKGLRLYVTGGTVLGAVRHKGYIPWDDDIDLALPRKDYDILVECLDDELPDNMKLRWMSRGRHFTIINTDYEIELEDDWKGLLDEGETPYLFIDLQPIDGVANTQLTRWIRAFSVMYRRALFKMSNPKRLYKGKRPLYEKIMIKALSILKSGDERLLADKYDNAMKKYAFDDSKYVAIFCGRYNFKDIYPKKWWVPEKIVEFENTVVRIPNGYDRYLKQIYGKYWIIPDEKSRSWHSKKM